MLIRPAQLRPYDFLTTGTAGRFINKACDAIAKDSALRDMLSHPQAQILSDLKARVKSSGKPLVKALYVSVRCPDASRFGGVRIRTLHATPDGMDWLEVPQDPALSPLTDLQARPGDWQMLRYIPLRRATLLYRAPNGPAEIIKVKRPDRATDAAQRLATVHAATTGLPGIAVPSLVAVDPRGTFTQSLCFGCPIEPRVAPPDPALLRRIGRLHAQLHLTPASGLPLETEDDPQDNLTLITALRPDLAADLRPAHRALRHRPAPSDPVLCHGDFGYGQILQNGAELALVDFDRAHLGEAAADMARFLVLLAETPLRGHPTQTAESAYLAGYAELRPLPEAPRLGWFIAQAAIARLLVRLRKDAAHPQPMARLLALLYAGLPA